MITTINEWKQFNESKSDDIDSLKKELEENSQSIKDQWTIKIKKLFKDYIGLKLYEYSDDLDDAKNIFWYDIVENGWQPKLINIIDKKYKNTGNIISDFSNDILQKVIKELKLDEQIFEL